MTPPSSPIPPRPRAERRLRARAAWLGPVAALGLLGCQKTIDMASVQDPSWAATTIPYTGVREATRQFPDYSSIDASILDAAGGKKPGKPDAKTKKGTPR